MAISAFSNLAITISDGGTVPSLDYLSAKTYVNIGSGNILKVSWNTPTATNNAVDSYKIYILYLDSASASYKSLYTANVGNVNEFFVTPAVFATITKSFLQLRIYVEAISKQGSAYNGTSNTVSINVSKGCGIYAKVEDGEPAMKRALAFARIAKPALTDNTGKVVTDTTGKTIYVKVSSIQDDETDWMLMQEFYLKDTSGNWNKSDIEYEALTDIDGDAVLDSNDSPIYIL